MFLHLLDILVPFHFVYITVFGVSFPQAGRSWFHLSIKSAPCGQGWTSSLSRFPG